MSVRKAIFWLLLLLAFGAWLEIQYHRVCVKEHWEQQEQPMTDSRLLNARPGVRMNNTRQQWVCDSSVYRR